MPLVISSVVAYFVAKATKTHEARLSSVQDIRARQLTELDDFWPRILDAHRNALTGISEGVTEVQRNGLRATDVRVPSESLQTLQNMLTSVYIPTRAAFSLREYMEFIALIASGVHHLRDQGRSDLALAWILEMGESTIYELKLRFREAYDIAFLDAEAGKLARSKRAGEMRVHPDDVRAVLELPRVLSLADFEKRINSGGALLIAEQIWPEAFGKQGND